MAVIKLVENYAVAQARKDIRDSLMMAGEECILLSMYHVGNDQDIITRCTCYNSVYAQSDDGNCPDCYGTTFEGGVKDAKRVWGLFTDKLNKEEIGERGVWAADVRQMQCEAFPTLMQRDYVVRVRSWSSDHRPLVIEGIYAVSAVEVESIRTGNRFGQWDWDIIGQRTTVFEMSPESAIFQYPILNREFPDSLVPSTNSSPPVIEPDTKVLIFPAALLTTPLPGTGATSVYEVEGFTYTQPFPAETWTIDNPLGRLPNSVNVIINGKTVDADVSYPDQTTIVINFGSPLQGIAEVS